eukprot:GDKJ01045294.1.p1 GENE.GDKJ01045294.1~~GDKJ01045294.1.p1  ORF type:complete len:188 (+),score=9.10 GDKJ01045294.1:80-643(+)
MRIDFIAIARCILIFICFIMTCVGTSRPQFSNGGSHYYLYKLVNGDTTVYYGDIGCGSFRDKMRAGYAFGILASIVLGFALLSIFLLVISALISKLESSRRLLVISSLLLSILAWIFLIIAWPVSASGRTEKHCGSTSTLANNGYGISEGLGLLIASWVLLIFDIVLGVLGLFGKFGSNTDVNVTKA